MAKGKDLEIVKIGGSKMKKRYIGVILLFVAASLSGCNKKQEEPLESTEFITAETTVSTAEMTEDIDSAKDINSIYVPDVMPENDIAYKETCSTYYQEDKLVYLWIYTYDEHDNLLMEERLNVETKECESSAAYAYIYNEQNLVEVKYWGSPDKYEVFLYNDNGELIESSRFADGEEAEHHYYAYDENDNLIQKVEVQGNKYLDCTIEYEYDEKGNISVSRLYDSDGNLNFTNYHEYNEENQVIKIITEFPKSANGNYYTTYEYDKNGNTICENGFYIDAEKPFFSYIYEYDSNNRCIRKESFKYGESEWIDVSEYEDK